MQDFFCLAAEAAAAAIQLGRTFAIKSIPSFIHFAVSGKSILFCVLFLHIIAILSCIRLFFVLHTQFFLILFCVLLHTIAFLPCHIF
jgi:hypothetical protein